MFANNGIEMFQVKSRAFADLTQTIKDCEKEGVSILIIDSITHVWKELIQSYDEKLHRKGRMQFQDWAIIKPEWQRGYVDPFLNSSLHILALGRAGYEWDYDWNEDGSKDLVKTGTKFKAEAEFGFEPSLVIEMERVSKNLETIESLKKDKQRKQTFKPKVGSQWVHRAHVLKDRSDTLDGQSFDDPTFMSFLPHFQSLNIGGQQLGVDTSRTSHDLFDAEGKPDWKREADAKKISLDTIQGWLTTYFPGSTASEKKAKLGILKFVFGKPSWEFVCSLNNELIQLGQRRVENILKNKDNIAILLGEVEGQIVEPPAIELPEEDDIPLNLGREVTA
jgi:hypothetical protein